MFAVFLCSISAWAQVPDCSQGTCAGVGVPSVACHPGNKYAQMDAPGTNWTCTGLTPHWVQDAGGGASLPTATYQGQMLAASGSGSTYTVATAQCSTVITDAAHVCITAPPYSASNSGLTTTTTSATFGVGTSGSVASCSTFSANQGVLITGAGAAGANYVGTVVSCSGTALTVTPSTATSVASGTVVQHDESAAFQSAVTAGASAGITIYVPDGTYLVNGALQDTSGANAVITLPHLAYGTGTTVSPVIAFKGFTTPSTETASGAIITSSIPSGNLLGGYYSVSSIPNFTNYLVSINNITFRGPHNPGMVMANLTWAVAADIEHIRCDTGSNGDSPLPSNAASGCLFLPTLGNNVAIRADAIIAAGYGTCVKAGEHANIGALNEANCINGLVPDSGSGSPYAGNVINVNHFWCQLCTNQLAGGAGKATINIETMDVETPGTFGINDPSNLLYGTVNFNVQAATGPVTPGNPAVNGAANLAIRNLQFPQLSGVTGIPISTSGLQDDWPSQEGAGSTLLNTYTLANTATASNVTWAYAAGFTGKVANYNGTTSTATAATNNTFDGTTAFSACAWINPTTLPAVAVSIVGDIGGASPFPGWRMDMYGTGGASKGAIVLYLINNVGTNVIQTGTPFQVILVGQPNLACFTYGGVKDVSSVRINVNGVNQTLSTTTNTLSGSILSSLPVTIGSNAGTAQFFPGAIGRVRIFTRVLSGPEMTALYGIGPNAF